MNQEHDKQRNQVELEKLIVPAVARWILSSAELPPEKKNVLIYTDEGIRVGMLVRDTLSQKLVWDLRDDWKPVWEVSHWMPLPKKPEEESK